MLENEYEGLDEMFKSGLENSRISPPPGVWEGVAASVAGTGAGVGAGIGIFGKVILGVALSAGLGVGAYFYVQGQKQQPQLPNENMQEIVTAPVQQEAIENEVPLANADRKPTQVFVAPSVANDYDEYKVNEQVPVDNVARDERLIFGENSNDRLYDPMGDRDIPNASSEIHCGHKASITVSLLEDNRYMFKLNYPENTSNITWYIDGAPEYAGEANSHSLVKTFAGAGSTFAVKAKLRSGNCWDSATQKVTVVVPELPKAPNVFSMPYNVITPNGDGLNEEFYVEIANYDYFEINVIDLNGKQIFRSTDPNLRWTGKCGTIDCAEGKYRVVVKYLFKGENTHRYKRMDVFLTR